MSIKFEALSAVVTHVSGACSLRIGAYGYSQAGLHGRTKLRVRARSRTSLSLVIPTPQLPLVGQCTFSITASGTTSYHEVVDGRAVVRLSHRGFAGRPGTISGRTWLRLRTFGAQGLGGTAYALLIPQAPEVSGYGGQWFGTLDERFSLGSQPSRLYTAVIRTPLKLGTRRRSRYDGALRAVEQFSFADATSFVVHMLAADGISFGTLATGDYRMLARAVSRLILAGYAGSYAEALQQVADALVFGDLVEWMQLAGAADTLALNDRIDALYAAFARVVERLVLAAEAAPEFTLTVMLRDTFALGTQATHEAELAAQIADAIGFAMALSFDNGEFIAWVMNTESRGLSRYTNYPFNSFAKIGERYYGAHSGGIARLGGRDDMGEPIRAKLRLGMTDFGDRRLKGVSEVFIGAAAGGQLLLKAIFVDEVSGEKTMAVYKVAARPAGASRETRAKLGRGMRAVDWDFVLENVNGADFDLQSVQFHPTTMSRRTRG
ncbi:hypothetical protein [Stenotrophomonas acidaminiphila]|uniref:hypothetical protein n=1 Tax=Stenotrophomonas acidaminiphila TaxID=128780 RepID=UPI0028B20B0E|nr:hypothetical protein [Stenotrophomonas acidaminiphila]